MIILPLMLVDASYADMFYFFLFLLFCAVYFRFHNILHLKINLYKRIAEIPILFLSQSANVSIEYITRISIDVDLLLKPYPISTTFTHELNE